MLRFQELLNSSELVNIKCALLRTPGPVCTFLASTNSGPRQLRKISREIYDEACYSLQADNLADVVHLTTMPGTGRTTTILVKKSPDLVRDILQANPDLCSMDVYQQKYTSPLPLKITDFIRRKLVAHGCITEEQAKFVKKD